MSLSGLWWFLLIIVLMLSPMSMLMPSARQKKLIILRDKALELGIKVTVLPNQVNENLTLEGSAYRWLRPAEAPPLAGYLCLLKKQADREQGALVYPDWQLMSGKLGILSAEQQAGLGEWLTQLPEDAFAVEWGSATLTFWWYERDINIDLNTLNSAALAVLAIIPKQ